MKAPIDTKEECEKCNSGFHIYENDNTTECICPCHTPKEEVKCKGCKNGKREGCYTCTLPKENDSIQKLINKRNSRMYGYYKSVFEDNFGGGYPIEWDTEFIDAIRSLLQNRDREIVESKSKSLARELERIAQAIHNLRFNAFDYDTRTLEEVTRIIEVVIKSLTNKDA